MRSISGTGGEALIPVGECFIQLQISKSTFQDRVIIIDSLKCNYILGQVLHRNNRFSTGYSISGRHYININGEMIAQSISQATTYPILKNRGNVTLPPMSASVAEIKMPIVPNTNNLYELDFDTFQLPEGVIPLDVLHRKDHKTPKTLNIPIMNTNNTTYIFTKNSPIATLMPVGRCGEVQEVSWTQLQDNTARLLPRIPSNTNPQLKPYAYNLARSIPDADILDEASDKLKELLNIKYINNMSQTATDIGWTNIMELDIPTEGPPIALKP